MTDDEIIDRLRAAIVGGEVQPRPRDWRLYPSYRAALDILPTVRAMVDGESR